MKKSIFFIAMMLIGTTYMTAQEYVYFGVKGGVNFSNISGDGFSTNNFEEGANARTAFHLGLVAEVPLSERFSIQPEVLYSAQGFDLVQIDDNKDVEFQMDYITVPVLAKLYVVDGLSISAGPQFGFLVDSEISSENSETDLNSENFNNFDMSLGLGAGYKFSNFFIYGRYNAGLTDVYEANNTDAKNSVVQAGVGFMF
ncbi:MAG TPA: porin family protein [Salinimicrobium sp.]|nr:porin family protein [Salinimicrobium sp.]